MWLGCDGTVRDYNYDIYPWTSIKLKLGLAESENVKRYGSSEPPLLDPKNIRVPLKIYYTDGDDFVPPQVNKYPSIQTMLFVLTYSLFI